MLIAEWGIDLMSCFAEWWSRCGVACDNAHKDLSLLALDVIR